MSETATPRRARRSSPGRVSLEALAVRVTACEDDIHEMKGDLKIALTEFGKLKDRLNIWGSLIIGAMAAGGLISEHAAALLKALAGGVG